MKFVFQQCSVKTLVFRVIYCIAMLSVNTAQAQTCPPPITTGIAINTNTYYPGLQATVNAGSTSIAIGAAPYGVTPVSAGDVLLIIQMQGAQIVSANDNTYGDGVNGRGYLNNAQLGVTVTGPVMPFPGGCMVLPIKFLEVNGKRDGTKVQINWEVSDEKDLTNYIIERSYNGYEFTSAGMIGNKPEKGLTGNYSFSDAMAGKDAAIYYRIKAQDATGQTFFSKVITIQPVLSKDILDISPVPTRRYTMIKWPATGNSKLTVTLFDVDGRFVLCRQNQLRNGMNELLLTNLEALSAGIYFIKASDGASYRNGKLRIQK
jgi:hypothetical protein